MNNLFKNKWYFVLGILSFLIIWVIIWYSYPNKHSEVATLFVLSITFLAIVIYTIETTQLKRLTKSNLYDNRFYKLLEKKEEFVRYENRKLSEVESQYLNNIFDKIYDEFREHYQTLTEFNDEIDRINKVFISLFNGNYQNLVRYMLIVTDYFLFIDKIKQIKLNDEYNFYNSIFFNSCSLREVIIIFYLGIRFEEMRTLINKNELLNSNVVFSFLINKNHLDFYPHLLNEYKSVKDIENDEQ